MPDAHILHRASTINHNQLIKSIKITTPHTKKINIDSQNCSCQLATDDDGNAGMLTRPEVSRPRPRPETHKAKAKATDPRPRPRPRMRT